MKLLPLLTAAGILALIMYGISRTINSSRLLYLIQNAVESPTQLAMLITITNNQGQAFSQQGVKAIVKVNGQLVSTIENDINLSIPANQVTAQAWLLDLPAAQIPGGSLKLIQILGTVVVDSVNMPLDLKYKFI